MRRLCSWCEKDLDGNPAETGEAGRSASPITHGICPDCLREVLAFKGEPMLRFLNRFPGPVYLVNDDYEVVAANRDGAELLGREPEDFEGKILGQAIECEFSYISDGCGKTEHCRTCTIRRALAETIKTGKSNIKIPAYPDLHNMTGENKLKYLISTEKIGEAVMLKIEMIPED